jgi:methionine-S-sulfoxide reductase
MRGVVGTRTGYAGGTTPDPTYHDLGDHTEVVRVRFDPGVVSYRELVEVFFDAHDPFRAPFSRQYRSVVLAVDENQERIAREVRDEVDREDDAAIVTGIEELDEFTSAEDYHQKYELMKHPDLVEELNVMYPDFWDLVDSTVAARLNGYVAGYGSREQLEEEIESFGLSDRSEDYVREIVGGLTLGCGVSGHDASHHLGKPFFPR